jgi:hypothetical protein
VTPPLAVPAAPSSTDGQEVVARAQAEVRSRLEELRARVVAACLPAGGAATAQAVFQVVFDAAGNEIGRGVSVGRRAPRAFGGCVRELAATKLSIAPPGRTVSVRVPVAYP